MGQESAALPSFAVADLCYTNEFVSVDPAVPGSPLKVSYFTFSVLNIGASTSNKDIVQSIKDINSVIEKSPLADTSFAFGPTFNYWTLFIDLEAIVLEAVLISLGTVFSCTFACLAVFSQPLTAAARARNGFGVCRELLTLFGIALLTSLACGMIVFEIWGLNMSFMKFNPFVAAVLLATTGIAIEFVAHFVAHFVVETGTPQQRLCNTISATCPAVLAGSLSTIVGLLPMILSEYEFVVKYCLGMLVMVQAVGLLNGFVFLPSLLGPLAAMRCLPSPDGQSQTTVDTANGKVSMPTMLTHSTNVTKSSSGSDEMTV